MYAYKFSLPMTKFTSGQYMLVVIINLSPTILVDIHQCVTHNLLG